MNLVKCRFLDENKEPKGREYTYGASESFTVGEIVSTQTGKEVVITEVGVSEDAIEFEMDKLKSVTRLHHNKQDQIPLYEVIEGTAVVVDSPIEIRLPEISVSKENIAIVEQLPVITEQLRIISAEIDSIVSAASLMECTAQNRQSVKKARADINALLSDFEKRRIAIKDEILKPYETFNADYKNYVSDKIKSALKTLDGQITIIESGMKQELRDSSESYFYEYSAFVNIDWLTWEQSGIVVGLSDNPTGLRKKVKAFIDKVADDLVLIDTQDYSAEILVEYHKDLNVAKSISTIKARFKAVEEQKRLQSEAEERKRQQEEQRRIQAEALEKARREYIAVALESPRQEINSQAEYLPKQPEKQSIPQKENLERIMKINTTREKLVKLRDFLEIENIEYEVL